MSAGFLDVGEIKAGLIFPANEEKWNNWSKDIENGKEIAGETFGAHAHNFNTSDDIEWKSKN